MTHVYSARRAISVGADITGITDISASTDITEITDGTDGTDITDIAIGGGDVGAFSGQVQNMISPSKSPYLTSTVVTNITNITDITDILDVTDMTDIAIGRGDVGAFSGDDRQA